MSSTSQPKAFRSTKSKQTTNVFGHPVNKVPSMTQTRSRAVLSRLAKLTEAPDLCIVLQPQTLTLKKATGRHRTRPASAPVTRSTRINNPSFQHMAAIQKASLQNTASSPPPTSLKREWQWMPNAGNIFQDIEDTSKPPKHPGNGIEVKVTRPQTASNVRSVCRLSPLDDEERIKLKARPSTAAAKRSPPPRINPHINASPLSMIHRDIPLDVLELLMGPEIRGHNIYRSKTASSLPPKYPLFHKRDENPYIVRVASTPAVPIMFKRMMQPQQNVKNEEHKEKAKKRVFVRMPVYNFDDSLL